MRRLAGATIFATACATAGGSGDGLLGSDSGAATSAAAGGSGGTGSVAVGSGGATMSASSASSANGTGSSTSVASSTSSSNVSSTAAASASSAASSGSGGGTGDPWFQVDYKSGSTPTSPAWSFSPTPLYPASAWAYQGKNFPEIWDVYNSEEVKFDPMGAWAVIIDTGDTWQAMLGFGKLKSVADIDVQLEGRGYSVSSNGVANVYNPLNNCGSTVTMANDWKVHVAHVSLAGCIIPGNATQAIRIKPTQQGLALSRVKVTLVGAVY